MNLRYDKEDMFCRECKEITLHKTLRTTIDMITKCLKCGIKKRLE